MSPLQIEILLHYYARTDDYRDGDFSAPAVRAAIDDFRERGFLLTERPENWESDHRRTYWPSEAVDLYVKTLCAVPMPVKAWIIPAPPKG